MARRSNSMTSKLWKLIASLVAGGAGIPGLWMLLQAFLGHTDPNNPTTPTNPPPWVTQQPGQPGQAPPWGMPTSTPTNPNTGWGIATTPTTPTSPWGAPTSTPTTPGFPNWAPQPAVQQGSDVIMLGCKAMPNGKGHIQIMNVPPGTVANRLGLQPGDIFEGVDGRFIDTLEELAGRLARVGTFFTTEVTVLRGDRRLTAEVRRDGDQLIVRRALQ